MKTFLPTFLAIVAGGALLLASLTGKQRLDKWNEDKLQQIAELNVLATRVDRISDDPIGALNDRSRSLHELTTTIGEEYGVELHIISLLENKPFWLPLTKSEKRLLKSTKGDVEKADKSFADSTGMTIVHTGDPVPKAFPGRETRGPPGIAPSVTPRTAAATQTPGHQTLRSSHGAASDAASTVTIVNAVTVELVHGSVTLAPGTRLTMISRGETSIQVRYMGEAPIIPISATDVH